MINQLIHDIENFIKKNNFHFFIEEIYEEFKSYNKDSINIALEELKNIDKICIYNYGKTKIVYNNILQNKILDYKNAKNFFLTELNLNPKISKKLFKIDPLTLEEFSKLKNSNNFDNNEIKEIEVAINNLENSLKLATTFQHNLVEIYDISLKHILKKSSKLRYLNNIGIFTYSDFINTNLSPTMKKNVLIEIEKYIPIIENRNIIHSDFLSETLYYKYKEIYYTISKNKLNLIKNKIEIDGFNNFELLDLLFDEYYKSIKTCIKINRYLSKNKLSEKYSYLQFSYLNNIINSLIKNNDIFENEIENEITYFYSYKSILEKVIELDDKEKEIFTEKINGKTLQTIAEPLNLTRERVRQILSKIINTFYNNDYFIEENYSYLFQNYNIPRKAFETFKSTNGIITYNYLDLKYSKGKKEMRFAFSDNKIPKYIKEDLNIYFYRDYFNLGDDKIKIDRTSIIVYILKNLATDGIDFDTLTELYNDVINHIPQNKITSKIINLGRGVINQLSDSKFILWNMGKFRYYNIDNNDYTELLDILNLEQYKDVEISTLKFLRDYPELMKKYDIRDQYELHNLLKKIYPSKYINYGRMPTLEFGQASRQKQVLDLLFETAPIHKDDLALEYEKIYGIEKPTFFSNYLHELNMFMENDILKIDYNFLSNYELKILKEKLTEDFYTTTDLKNIFYETFGYEENGKINPFTLNELNFKNYVGYVVSNKYNNIHNYIISLFKNNPLIDLSKIKLTNTTATYAEISKLKRNFEIVEYEYRKYININELNKRGVTKEKIKEYISHILSKLNKDEIFSIKYLRDKGYHYDIADNLPDYFYSSILTEMKDEIISRHSTKNILMMFNSDNTIKIIDVIIERIITDYNSLKIEDLISIIKEKYGLIFEKYKLEYNIIDNKNIFYDKENNIIQKY